MSQSEDQPVFGKRTSPVQRRSTRYAAKSRVASVSRANWLEPALIVIIVTLLLATFSLVS